MRPVPRTALGLALLALMTLGAADARAAQSGQGPAADAPALASAPAPAQVLVMLPVPPRHYRPDSDYLGVYDAQPGHDARRRVAGELAAANGLRLLQDWPMAALGVDCYVMELAPGDSVDAKLRELARDARIESVQAMNTFRALGHDDPLYPLQPAASAWHLADLHQVTTGRGVTIALIDSGVDVDHPDLAGQVRDAQNFVGDAGYAAERHGTEVAGIVGARADNGVGIAGVAPDARLLALRACWQVGAESLCNSFTLAKAMQFALDRDVQVINLSLTGPRDRLLERLLDSAWRRGITVVAAADARAGDGGFPASDPWVLSVGLQEAGGALPASEFDVLAPGRDVPTTEPGSSWGFVTGSSFAAAHVSGLVALVRQLAPGLGPQQIRVALAADRLPVAGDRRARIGAVDTCAVIGHLAAGSEACRSVAAAHVEPLR